MEEEIERMRQEREEEGYEMGRGFRVKYFKVLEIAQLIKKEVLAVESKVPRNCLEGVESIKRYLTII